jgi:hypothetical protein
MAKILSYKNNRDKFLVIVVLIISIVITNSFIIFSPDEDSRFYFSGLTSTLALGVALVISIVMVYKYKRSIKKQEEKQQALSQQSNHPKLHHYYYDNNKIHFSICLFFAFWFAASVNWTFEDQEAPGVLIADVLYYLGYASFGYFLYSMFYHFFRKEFEPFILFLIAVIILVPLIFVVDTIVSTLRLLSIQTIDISLVIVNASYPVLDAIMIFPIAIMFWAVRGINSRHKNATLEEQQKTKEKDKTPSSSSFVSRDTSMWILLMFISMLLSAAGDSGFAYTSAFDVTTVQNYIWMWNILYNSDHLCLAAALIGYKHFFTFNKIDTLQQ